MPFLLVWVNEQIQDFEECVGTLTVTEFIDAVVVQAIPTNLVDVMGST